MNKKILINCSNLHTGGGVAVASSFIDSLSRLDVDGYSVSLLLSSPVSRNLNEMGTDMSPFSSCIVQDYYGMAALWKGLDQYFKGMDIVFTIFGPAYCLRKRTCHLVGFAQPNIIYPDNPINARRNLFSRWKTRCIYAIQSYFFRRADGVVVELEHVKVGLLKRSMFRSKPIYIVYSSVHSVFTDSKKWAPLALPRVVGVLKLGIISRNYPHKNLSILIEVKRQLLKSYGQNVDFYVTFQPDEWAACDVDFRKGIINVGGLSLSQCPTFYEAMDGIIFPSLLECFSAVPIESMMVRRPLFASNLSFIRDVCDIYCNYFEPLDASDIARVIHNYYCLPVLEQKRLTDAAYAHVQRYPGPEVRAENYMNLVKSILNQTQS